MGADTLEQLRDARMRVLELPCDADLSKCWLELRHVRCPRWVECILWKRPIARLVLRVGVLGAWHVHKDALLAEGHGSLEQRDRSLIIEELVA